MAAVALGAVSAASPATRNGGPPDSIGAIGDSITTGACTDRTCSDRPANSWSTGTNPAVDSHLLRLRAVLKSSASRASVRAFDYASSLHVTMADLATQAREAVHDQVRYVTIEIGENDLCSGVSPASFRSNLERGLAVLSRSANHPKILLLSIENLAAHWRALRNDPTAARALKAGAVLDCGLGYYTATDKTLSRVQSRAGLLNGVLAEVCSKHPLCLYDAGTYFRLPLRASFFSPADYQHLSLAGQRALAAAEWKVARKFLYD
ncbi:MAG TPA: GDSL-type esterase/lipase family protein [Gaiellaceae bacterium]|nr:GDSL-type esterase/lipase family protein [Gaiellaceae bacterium]